LGKFTGFVYFPLNRSYLGVHFLEAPVTAVTGNSDCGNEDERGTYPRQSFHIPIVALFGPHRPSRF
jgi:hypothetical protein